MNPPPDKVAQAQASLPDWVARHALGLVTGAFILLPALLALGYFLPPINHDTAAILVISQRWIEGERLYVDLIDINPPMTFVLNAFPVLVAKATGMSVPAALTFCFLLAIAASVMAAWHLLVRQVEPERRLVRLIFLLLLPFFLIVFPGENFTQREHLMMIAAFPYLLLAAARSMGRPVQPMLALAIAVTTALAVGQKPHFLIFLVMIELYVLWARGWRAALADMVPWTALAVLVIYLVLTLTLLPAYWREVLPLAFSEYAELGEGSPLVTALDSTSGPTLIALSILGAAAFFVSRSPLSRLLALHAAAMALSNILQAKGWPYHIMPAQAGTIVLLAVLMAEVVERLLPRPPEAARLPIAGLLGAFLILTYYSAFMLKPPFAPQRSYAESPTAMLLKLVKRDARGGRMLVLSPGIYPFYPLVLYARTQVVTPYLTMWLLQGLYHDCEEGDPLYREPADMSPSERKLFEEMGTILAERRPEVVVVDRIAGIPRCHEAAFDYLEYFLRNPIFAEAWQEYEHVSTLDRYVIYRRL
ncbi:MAG: hypothetical protein KIT81_11950 [Alphaproteobacteria bacterium]|nr:hypothetical protein [Alphaproteobacteria bacterium]